MTTDKYLQSFQSCYVRCCAVLSKSPLAHNYKFELYPYLYALFAYMLGTNSSLSKDTLTPTVTWIINRLPPEQHDKFWSRMNFYIDVVSDRVDIRAEWAVSEKIDFSNPFLRIYFAFGDILSNPACAIDYKNAPVLMNDIFDMREFERIMSQELTPIAVSSLSVFIDQRTPAKKSPHPSASRGTVLTILGIVVALVLGFSIGSSKAVPASAPAPTVVVTAPPATPYLPPVDEPENGHVFLSPQYQRLCPLSVSVSDGSSYYIYLKYMRAPENSYDSRKESGYGESEDLAFYVRSGETVNLDVPVGVYKLYYATGDVWYGTLYKFGVDTAYFSSDDLLDFYTSYDSTYGVTLELWAQYNGNFETDEISETAFPG